ncbi:MAG: hypothetical protein FWC69_05105 [Defluviitaleaceae bacterium]|nr:hypothetical protein [Defluviitaleaceae bacterium]
MEYILSQIEKIEDTLSRMDDEIDSSPSLPLSSKVKIEKEALFALIDDIRAMVADMKKGLPSEINQAKRVLSESESHVSEARTNAAMIIKAAQDEVERMTNEHEITFNAKKTSDEMIANASRVVEEQYDEFDAYVLKCLSTLEKMFKENLNDHMHRSRQVEDFYNNILGEFYDAQQNFKNTK